MSSVLKENISQCNGILQYGSSKHERQDSDCEEPSWILRRVPKLFPFCEKVVAVSLDVGKAVLFSDHYFRKTLDAASHSQTRDMDKTDEPKGGKTTIWIICVLQGMEQRLVQFSTVTNPEWIRSAPSADLRMILDHGGTVLFPFLGASRGRDGLTGTP